MGAVPTPWYATVAVQLPLILLFLILFILALVTSLLPSAAMGTTGRIILGITAAANSFLMVGLMSTIYYLLYANAESSSPEIPLSGWIFPIAWASVGLAVGMVYLWLKQIRERGTGYSRRMFAAATVAAVGFIPFLVYWGILGGKL
jgi:hypothetical protein